MNDKTTRAVEAALRRAYSLGQTYWRLADSDSYLKNAKADLTQRQFDALVQETVAAVQQEVPGKPEKLWLWRNFVDDRPEYWAFDNPYPINLDNGDPQTLGEPCGYALFKPSRQGRTDVSEAAVIAAIKGARP